MIKVRKQYYKQKSKEKGIYLKQGNLINPNLNSLLPKIDELKHIVKLLTLLQLFLEFPNQSWMITVYVESFKKSTRWKKCNFILILQTNSLYFLIARRFRRNAIAHLQAAR